MAMAAVSLRGLKRALIGSTAETVPERLPCDLLVVKSRSFANCWFCKARGHRSEIDELSFRRRLIEAASFVLLVN
jgi:hypothetical protein